MFHDEPLGQPPLLPPPAAPEGERPWRLRDVAYGTGFASLGFLLVLGLSVVFILRGDYHRTDPTVAFLLTLGTLGMEAWLGAIVLGLARARGIPLRALRLGLSQQWSWVPVALFSAYGCVLAYAAAVYAAERVSGLDLSGFRAGNQIPEDLPRTVAIWVALGLAVVVVAPLSEELFFRGLVYRGIADRFGPGVGMVVSGVAFALVHFNVSVVVPFTLIGIVFAWVYRASGSLWTTIAAHAIFNGVSFVATVYGVAQ